MATTTQRVQAEPATSRLDLDETGVGSVFVSNYPAYSFWSGDFLAQAHDRLEEAPLENTLGLYLHIPFCRKRCKFCYFRVYTDKNSSQIDSYLDALAREVELYSKLPAVSGRPLKFVYFGGGTPSFISVKHLQQLVERLKNSISWDGADEVTFECEPGTLTHSKLVAIREIGVTRLSLGIENFNDEILRENGRAHLSDEIYRTLPWIRELDFEQLNIDLIAGMVGETWDTWKDNVKMTIDTDPDSVTIYQMELPFNTEYTRMLKEGANAPHIANWKTKREWNQYAIDELTGAGYELSSAYTLVKKKEECRFVYRDSVWRGTDMIGAGVASFGHMSGMHLQNSASWDEYIGALEDGSLPLTRAFPTTASDRLTREMILQLKLGKIQTAYFKKKFGADVVETFSAPLSKLRNEGMLEFDRNEIRLTDAGLLRADTLLPEFYEEKYRGSRYT